ncbi:hypothetical protein G7046_g183 [Stylonectria norvegica]|nr:hypothetical protein G7046_g183 [Stylonectria norvegica]
MLSTLLTLAIVPILAHAIHVLDDNGPVQDSGLLRFPLRATSGAHTVKEKGKRQNDVGLTTQQTGIFYSIDIVLGTPGQTVTVNFDTGSSELWVNPVCSNSTNPTFCETFGRFEESSTFVDLGTKGSITYGTGFTNFEYGYDFLSIGPAKINQQIFGVAYASEHNTVGIMGAGPDVSGWDNSYPLILDNLAQQGLINSRAFSLDIRSLESERGSVVFGGIDTKKYSGPLEKLPIIPAAESPDGNTRYWVNLDSISLTLDDGTTAPVLSQVQAVLLDSGATVSALPGNIVDAIVAVFPTTRPNDGSQFYEVDCSVIDLEGTVDFTFGNTVIKIPYADFIWQRPDVGLCLLGVTKDDEFPVLGDTFLRAAYVVYDWDNRNIHLANNEDCGSNLIAIGTGPDSVPSIVGECGGPTSTQSSSTRTPTPTESSTISTTKSETSTAITTTESETSTTASVTESESSTTNSATESAITTSSTDGSDTTTSSDPTSTTASSNGTTSGFTSGTTSGFTSGTTSGFTSGTTFEVTSGFTSGTTWTSKWSTSYSTSGYFNTSSTAPTTFSGEPTPTSKSETETETSRPTKSGKHTSSGVTTAGPTFTSTITTSKVYTITSCPPSVTRCPFGSVTTEMITSYTTYCPGNQPATTRAPLPRETSTVKTTKVHTVTDCPGEGPCHKGDLTTEVLTSTTYICPEITATYTIHKTLTCGKGIPSCQEGDTKTTAHVFVIEPVPTKSRPVAIPGCSNSGSLTAISTATVIKVFKPTPKVATVTKSAATEIRVFTPTPKVETVTKSAATEIRVFTPTPKVETVVKPTGSNGEPSNPTKPNSPVNPTSPISPPVVTVGASAAFKAPGMLAVALGALFAFAI